MVGMDLWHPPTAQPHLFEWWRPLLLASYQARVERVPWPIHIDEMQLMGRVDRGTRPSVWIYKHAESRGELYLDAGGQPYKFTKTPKGKSLGRFTACEITTAIFRADLPAFVEPVFYDEPPRRRVEDDGWDDEDLAAHAPRRPEVRREPRRRGHLTVIDGGAGRPMAG
jgi:hypothetical protein